MWNDTDLPLAHLITFRCYGTWRYGDERGSIDRKRCLWNERSVARTIEYVLYGQGDELPDFED